MKRAKLSAHTVNGRQDSAQPAGRFRQVALAAALASIMAGPAQAAFVTTGNVISATGITDPANWVPSTIGFVGNTADGRLTIDAGSAGKGELRIGRTTGVTGTLTVDGAGSTYTTGNITAGGDQGSGASGNGGTGIVNLTHGGSVITNVATFGGYPNSTGILNVTTGGHFVGTVVLGGNSGNTSTSATGIATVDGVGSSITGTTATTVGNSGTGLLKITHGGSIANTGGTIGAIAGSTGLVSVDGTGSSWTTTAASTSALNVGFRGNGTLQITSSGSVASYIGRMGRFAGSSGHVMLDGPGSSWSVGAGGLFIGGGSPTATGITSNSLITVTDGAALSVQADAQLAVSAGSEGTTLVNGAGSAWTSTGVLRIGSAGTGRASVTDGGTVAANSITVNGSSLLTVDLGTGSAVTATGGEGLANDGTIRLVAGAGTANGSYAPISAATWTGAGTVQALGGVYDPTTHTVGVSTAAAGTAGVEKTIDLSTTQRLLITDTASGQAVGASFQAASAPTDLGLTASLMGGSQLNSLQGLLDPDKAILSAWNFSATGYAQGDPTYLSLEVGPGQRFLDLAVWHFNGATWDKYANTDLAYENGFASFAVTGFSGYAVSGVAPVPVPAAAWLFGSALAGLAGFTRRKGGPVSM
ncbi:hypothetical protein [Methylococcus sp. EFPC2]|uniref:beta strand repeat-containing protein n=1 Tax=Methylococcus sp. EFPC2 TaxID=2812648 RepID=UPI0019683AEE|nr:hypothetical protein [Methylococcus sp. EFPC2]QSA95754.1 hypothetical protein JWZ97_10885 [Methylococcus sp. EFPC2]